MMSEPVDSNRSNWAVLKDCLLYWQEHFEGLSTTSSGRCTMLLLQFFRTDKAYIVNLYRIYPRKQVLFKIIAHENDFVFVAGIYNQRHICICNEYLSDASLPDYCLCRSFQNG